MNGEFVINYSSVDVPIPGDCLVSSKIWGASESYEIGSGRDIIGEWQPADPKDVAIELSIEIGRRVAGVEEVGTTFFYTAVYTHLAVDRIRLEHDSKIDTKRCIVVHEFDWQGIKRSVQNILKKCERDTFDESIRQIARRFRWEYGN